MNRLTLESILHKFQNDQLSIDDTIEELKNLAYEDLPFAKIDHHRALRQGFPEVVFCLGKTVNQVVTIIESLGKYNQNILATRATPVMYEEVRKLLPDAEYYESAQLLCIRREKLIPESHKYILVVTAGTSDIPVAEEAAITAEIMGNRVERIYDVGVAGLHRLMAQREKIENANVIIVVAGMEGALASVIGGIAPQPVIAVPTSIGYGASFNGLAALLGMLNSCAAGVGVVNIDNGFGAGRLASIINKKG